MLIPFSELWRKHKIRPDGILHVGANTGQEAEEYNKLGVKQVVWVEAIPEVHLKLVQHVGRMPGHQTILACVSDRDGDDVQFHVASNQGQSSSFLEFGTHATTHPNVRWVDHIRMRTSRLDTLLMEKHLRLSPDWFLNMDLQGAELLALKGLGTCLDCFKWAYLEVNEKQLYKGCPLVGELDQFMKEKGFVGADSKMSGSHGWGDKLYIRKCSQP